MSEPPSFRVTRGDPTPDEEAAIRAAILRIWRDEQAAAARTSGESAWIVAARAAAARTRAIDAPGIDAWRWSLRFDAGPLSIRRTGRGDSK